MVLPGHNIRQTMRTYVNLRPGGFPRTLNIWRQKSCSSLKCQEVDILWTEGWKPAFAMAMSGVARRCPCFPTPRYQGLIAPVCHARLSCTLKGEWEIQLGVLAKPGEDLGGKTEGSLFFSQDTWLSLFSQALSGGGKYGDRQCGDKAVTENLCTFLSILLWA